MIPKAHSIFGKFFVSFTVHNEHEKIHMMLRTKSKHTKMLKNRVSHFGNTVLYFLCFFAGFTCISCEEKNPDDLQNPLVDRLLKLPGDIAKQGPETDEHPPILHSDEFELPVPVSSGINTSGAEDSPFILPDGNTMYFFFTPDVRIPVQQQLLDSVTGIWVSEKVSGTWSNATRLWLQVPGKLALDGAVAIQGDEMWFASAREGYEGVNMFTSEFIDNEWKNWTYSGDRLMKEIKIGEVHLHGDDLYFHSDRTGGLGGYDIWVTSRNGEEWSDPLHLANVNSSETDGWPYISSDGTELWFTRWYMGTPGIFRSRRNGDTWEEPELIVSQFAGEPTLDDEGNLYFVHHYYSNNVMIEADIYVAYKK